MQHSVQGMIRDLHRRRGRERRSLALVEGVRLVEEALASGCPVRAAAVAPALEATPRGRALKAALAARAAALEPVDDATLAGLAATAQPQGVVAVVEPRAWVLDDLAPGRSVLVLDAVQDPGNAGTMLRTAHALGAAGVVALPGTVELLNPKVLRAAMGAHFHRPAVEAGVEAFVAWARGRALPLVCTALDAPPLDRATLPRPAALVVGNEGAGITPALRAAAAQAVALPLEPGAESLNVGAAAAILLWELRA